MSGAASKSLSNVYTEYNDTQTHSKRRIDARKNCAQKKGLISVTLTTYYFSMSLNFLQKQRLGTTFVPTTE